MEYQWFVLLIHGSILAKVKSFAIIVSDFVSEREV